MTIETYISDKEAWRSLASGDVLARFATVDTTGWARLGGSLTEYAGTHFITEDTVIEDQHIVLEGLFIHDGANVTMNRCHIECFVDVDAGSSLEANDCNFDGPLQSNPTVSYYNIILRRCAMTGGQHSVQGSAIELDHCLLHEQYNDPAYIGGYHNNAFICNGGGDIWLHNGCTFDCATELTPNGGGPTGDVSFFGDFSPIHDILVEDCLFKITTGGFAIACGYNPSKEFGDNPTNVVIRNNWFERREDTGYTGAFGTCTSFRSAAVAPGNGNLWTNNRYMDDASLVPAVE